tara:strand:- start:419 stop:670 length:252 start_codon:yes stop_codon:yes gene_type:complete
MIEYVIGILALAIVGGIVYKGVTKADEIIGEPPVVQPKSTKLSKARLTALTKAQLLEKGKELGIDVDKKLVKSKIVNQVYKAQ